MNDPEPAFQSGQRRLIAPRRDKSYGRNEERQGMNHVQHDERPARKQRFTIAPELERRARRVECPERGAGENGDAGACIERAREKSDKGDRTEPPPEGHALPFREEAGPVKRGRGVDREGEGDKGQVDLVVPAPEQQDTNADAGEEVGDGPP